MSNICLASRVSLCCPGWPGAPYVVSMVLNSQKSISLILPRARITDVNHYIWFNY